MKVREILPEGYEEILHIDLQKDKKLAVIVNVLAAIIAILMCVIMHQFIPMTTLFEITDDIKEYFIRMLILIVSFVIYMVLHELVHGITMKYYGSKTVKYGFTGMYAFAGSQDYYDKKSYLVIAMAPIVLLGAILLILNFLVPLSYVWVVYIMQVANISGAAGDLFVTAKFAKLPKDILVKDTGVAMTVYSEKKN